MYLAQLPLVLFYRDRALLKYHFSKFGDEQVADMLKPGTGDSPQAKLRLRAWNKFLKDYDLPGNNPVSKEAAQEFLAALDKRRVPKWALLVAPLDQIRDAAGR